MTIIWPWGAKIRFRQQNMIISVGRARGAPELPAAIVVPRHSKKHLSPSHAIWERTFLKKLRRRPGPPDVPGHIAPNMVFGLKGGAQPKGENTVLSAKVANFSGSRARSPGAAGRNSCPETLHKPSIVELTNLGNIIFEKITPTLGPSGRPEPYCTQCGIWAQRRGPAQRRKYGFVSQSC